MAIRDEKILLGHGSGGKLMHDLIREVFVREFAADPDARLLDSAALKLRSRKLAFTTDTYVVKPLFFPGGNIGKLAVCGTINDLSVVGATPLFLSCGLVIEEGFDISVLRKVVRSMKRAAEGAGVQIVTGDTKVVERGSCDGLFVNTAGVGYAETFLDGKIQIGDEIIVSGSVGDHGMAIMAAREDFGLETTLRSDCAPVNGLVESLKPFFRRIRLMRDPTRGGLATVLNEFAEGTSLGILVDEEAVPIKRSVAALSELLGLDPLYVPNEGRVVLVCSQGMGEALVRRMRFHPLGKGSVVIGKVVADYPGKVCMTTKAGGTRILDMLVSDQLPRIC
jgi:hydrogenase expression/formation protein HypE